MALEPEVGRDPDSGGRGTCASRSHALRLASGSRGRIGITVGASQAVLQTNPGSQFQVANRGGLLRGRQTQV